MKVVLNGKEAELNNALPLKIKDWKALEKIGITQKSLQEASITVVSTLLFYVLNKANNAVTVEEVDDLELNSPILQEVIKAIGEVKIDKPFLTPSTSLPVSTDGQQEMLMN